MLLVPRDLFVPRDRHREAFRWGTLPTISGPTSLITHIVEHFMLVAAADITRIEENFPCCQIAEVAHVHLRRSSRYAPGPTDTNPSMRPDKLSAMPINRMPSGVRLASN